MEDNNRILLRAEAELDRLPELSEHVREFFSKNGFDEHFCGQIDIVVEEIFVNIASYAYPDGGEKDTAIECTAKDGIATIVFMDHGIPYDPLAKDDPVTGDPYGMTIGGYGIFMVKNIMDEVSYRYDDTTKQNILTMRKKPAKEKKHEDQQS
ncbi:MAG: ATP-binding protein [Lachnospiraceae bacterium]|nr:ATP-binding protein [Lachnospiraceae bacterium]